MLRRLTDFPRRFVLLTLLLVGLVCGVVAVAFHELIYLARHLLISNALLRTDAFSRVALTLLTPAIVAGILAYVVRQIEPSAATANLARVRMAWASDPRLLNWKTILLTFFLTPLSLGAGTPLGPEGPTVVLTAGISAFIARSLRLPKQVVRGMIPVGTAAGIAAIFNTPMTGVVFALEEVLGTASRGILGGTLVAAVAAAVVQRRILGGEHVLATNSTEWIYVWELAGFAFLGLLCGVVSGSLIGLAAVLRTRAEGWIENVVVRAAAAGLIVGMIGIFAPSTLSVGYESTSLFLKGGGSFDHASLSFLGKTIGFLIALSGGLIGGTFAPSLFIGAALGSAVGHGTNLLLPQAAIAAGPYAFVGMGAFFAGFLRTPISAVLIVIELTGDYELILPLMLATAVATAVSRRISPSSLTERQMTAEGYQEEDGADPLARLSVADVMTRDPSFAVDTMTFRQVTELLGHERHRTYPVVNAERQLIGLLRGDAIRAAARDGKLDMPIAEMVEFLPLTLRPEAELRRAIRQLSRAQIDRCPVVDDHGRLVGFIAPEDLLRARMASFDESGTHSQEFDILGRG
jgi:chloride channel protein, CIC family